MGNIEKIGENIKTVKELKDALEKVNDNDRIYFTGLEGFSILYEKDSEYILFDENDKIDEIMNVD
jgi:metal-dependent hydrolase (beta-lactamase superfamily II)